MKKILSYVLGIILLFSLTSCGNESKVFVPNINLKNDMEEYQDIDNKTYYKSKYVSFVREVKGYFETDIPFTILDDENIRIYDDLYFYEGDSFYLISSDYKHIWASLTNENSQNYNVLREQGEDVKVEIKKDGIYKVSLDMKTMLMDLSYKSEIKTPYYYPFETISIGVLQDKEIVYTDLEKNEGSDEFVIKNYDALAGKLYSFYSSFSHTSRYKLTVASDSSSYLEQSIYSDSYIFKMDGTYDIYVNNKTYEIKAVLNPLSAKYYCFIYDGGMVELKPKEDTPYIFEYQFEATSDIGGYGVVSDDLPKFYNKSNKEYSFTVEETDLLGENKGHYYFKKTGVYKITLDLLNLTLKVERIES